MTHFNLKSGVVQGNLFNRRSEGWSGKWKYTVAIDMSDYYNLTTPIHAVAAAILDGKVEGVVDSVWDRLRNDPTMGEPDEGKPDGYWLVVLEPYHRYAYPVMLAV